MSKKDEPYHGFEQGPIRPPSEAASLLIRVTRNCPWNRCLFCPVYKGAQFSVRPIGHVKRDIDTVHRWVTALEEGNAAPRELAKSVPAEERDAFATALHWKTACDMRNVFLQDANALFTRTEDLVEILNHLRMRFPNVRRITSYARSHTIARKTDGEMRALAAAGLTRVHIGMESGADPVLEMMKKGVTKAEHIEAGVRVKAAGVELSEYVMPGLGGVELSEIHACESADALNRMNPDFIRLRSLAVPPGTPLHERWRAGEFRKLPEVQVVREIRLFIEHLQGVTSALRSDHILNLLGELEGQLPEDQPLLLGLLDRFLALSPEEQALFQIGRRTGVFSRLRDLERGERRAYAAETCRRYGITPENVDAVTDELMMRFI